MFQGLKKGRENRLKLLEWKLKKNSPISKTTKQQKGKIFGARNTDPYVLLPFLKKIIRIRRQ
jgi:hypothetical protein